MAQEPIKTTTDRGEKIGRKTFLVAQVVAFLLSASLGRRSVCLGPGLVAVCSFPVLGVGCRSPVPWPLPLWLVAAPVFLVPAPVLAFLGKGDVPRTVPVVPLPVRASFGGMLAVLERRFRGRILTLVRMVGYSPPSQLRRFLAKCAFNPPAGAGGRASTCRAGSPRRFTFPSISLSSLLFASIVATHVPLYRYDFSSRYF